MAELSYKLIGSRIRRARMDAQLTQDQLAELANITSQHLSHIESATTKLSLPCLVSICNSLNITSDSILLDSITGKVEPAHIHKDIERVYGDCTTEETYHMLAVSTSVKNSMRTYPKHSESSRK